jgi:lipoprotein-anchoring transpeptidase ErfK/SrfK
MHIGKRPLVLALVGLGLCAGTGVPVAMREQGYWADRPLPARPLASRYTPADAMRLRPGQYRWAPYAGDGSPISVAIDLTNQRAFVFQGHALVGIAAISSGRAGHGTPTGTFPVLEKARYHRSNIYSNAPMPFMQRLTWGGIALHAGYNPGRPASHGCIRLPYAFARALFQATRVGATVTVMRGAPMEAPAPMEQAPELEMVSAEPAHVAPLRPGRQVAVMSTDRTVAYVTATML